MSAQPFGIPSSPLTRAEKSQRTVIARRKTGGDVRLRLQQRGLFELVEREALRTGATADEVCGRSRVAHVIRARHRCWYLLRSTLAWSFPAIARVWGVDHHTVMHGIAKIDAELQKANAPAGGDGEGALRGGGSTRTLPQDGDESKEAAE